MKLDLMFGLLIGFLMAFLAYHLEVKLASVIVAYLGGVFAQAMLNRAFSKEQLKHGA